MTHRAATLVARRPIRADQAEGHLSGQAGSARLAAGGEHEVSVTITRGDPVNAEEHRE